MSRRLWSESEDKRLRMGREAGMTYPELARRLGRTASSARRRTARLGLPRKPVRPRRWTSLQEALLRRMVQQGGRTYEQIGAAVGHTGFATRKRATDMGLGRRMPRSMPWTRQDDAELQEMAATRMPHHEIGQELGRTQAAVASRLYVLRGGPKPRLRA